jgi:hypothetical protein
MDILSNEQIGPKRFKTPQGYLLCVGVPIARTGTMMYGSGEIPVEAGDDGLIWITRDADALFDDETIASFNGMPVTDEHPPGNDVNPENWEKFCKGMTFNARRGEGDDEDVILADLLITNKQLIEEVENGKREVSAGYDANYEQLDKGVGRQSSIIGNHVALVEKGRCGPRCAIGDHQPNFHQEKQMPATAKPTGQKGAPPLKRRPISAVIRSAFADAAEAVAEELENQNDEKTGDEDGFDKGDGSSMGREAPGVHIHLNKATADEEAAAGYEARFQRLESQHQEILNAIGQLQTALNTRAAPAATADEDMDKKDDEEEGKTGDSDDQDKDDEKSKTGDEDKKPGDEEGKEGKEGKTGDSAALQTSFQALVADAEVLVPGFRVPTFDAAAGRAKTVDAMCAARRKVLGHLAATADGRALLGQVADLGSMDAEKSGCAEVAVVFKAAASLKKAQNNLAATGDSSKIPDPNAGKVQASPFSGAQGIGALQQALKEYHKQHSN